ncbi:RHS repeat-associated core domain-containing protein, partial [Enterobacter sp. BIDMC 26]|uniref:RHS repeat-associated core domain-containing protein n=1 Tax=Enterobacter sp. BIDMC 26 TaxID=1329838 RepID=UPI0004527767
YSHDNLTGSSGLEVDGDGRVISMEEYYPYGGTAIWTARNVVEADYKTIRYSGKERDATGLYYYGYRYYQPWSGRWLSADPAGTVDGLNVFRMVRNNPTTLVDDDGRQPSSAEEKRRVKKYAFTPFVSTDNLVYDLINKFSYSYSKDSEGDWITPLFTGKIQKGRFEKQLNDEKGIIIEMIKKTINADSDIESSDKADEIYSAFVGNYAAEKNNGVVNFEGSDDKTEIYILGHGAAGDDAIYLSPYSENKKFAFEVVTLLSKLGIPNDMDINLDFCWSAAATEPEGISLQQYQQALQDGSISALVDGSDSSFMDEFVQEIRENMPHYHGKVTGYYGVVHLQKKVLNGFENDDRQHLVVSFPVEDGSEFFVKKTQARKVIGV